MLTRTGKPVRADIQFLGGTVTQVAYSADGKQLAAPRDPHEAPSVDEQPKARVREGYNRIATAYLAARPLAGADVALLADLRRALPPGAPVRLFLTGWIFNQAKEPRSGRESPRSKPILISRTTPSGIRTRP